MSNALTICLREEAAAIARAAERLDAQQVEAALSLLHDCCTRRSKLVITGVGKSGIVARKIAATFSSIGITAVFLNPVDALHGDLGIVNADDVALLLSNSGETARRLRRSRGVPPQPRPHRQHGRGHGNRRCLSGGVDGTGRDLP